MPKATRELFNQSTDAARPLRPTSQGGEINDRQSVVHDSRHMGFKHAEWLITLPLTVVIVDVFKLSEFYPTKSVHPLSLLMLHPREIRTLWPQTVKTEKKKKSQLIQGEQMRCRVPTDAPGKNTRQKTSQTRN